jgi:UDPglucose 6-dehydrogenase
MIKYVSNAFLATKVSFINEIATLCERLNVNVADVSDGIGLDHRIAREFLNAGLGYGGSCLPKDTGVLQHIAFANNLNPKILTSVIEVNSRQPERLVERIEAAHGSLEGAEVTVLGLAFKPNTDDIRYSPAIALVEQVLKRGARVRVSDPEAWPNSSKHLEGRVVFHRDPYTAAQGADVVILATEWSEYQQLDLFRLRSAMRGDLFVDGRIARTRSAVNAAGLRYLGVGSGQGQEADPMVRYARERTGDPLGMAVNMTGAPAT